MVPGFTCFGRKLKLVLHHRSGIVDHHPPESAAPCFMFPQRSKSTCCHSLASYERDHHLFDDVAYLKQVNFREVKSFRFCGSTCFNFFRRRHFFPAQNSRFPIESTASGFRLTQATCCHPCSPGASRWPEGGASCTSVRSPFGFRLRSGEPWHASSMPSRSSVPHCRGRRWSAFHSRGD